MPEGPPGIHSPREPPSSPEDPSHLRRPWAPTPEPIWWTCCLLSHRKIPPWTYFNRDGEAVIPVGANEYLIDTTKPPAHLLFEYEQERLSISSPSTNDTGRSPERHVLVGWLHELERFLEACERRGRDGEFRDLLTPGVKAVIVLGYDMYCLDGNSRVCAREFDPPEVR